MSNMPGYIKVTKEAAYALHPDLDARIIAHIEQWRDSVKPGAMVTIGKMMCCSDGCGCPPDSQLAACKGKNHGMPVEIVMDHLFPEDGPCKIDGVEGVATQGPMIEVGLGLVKFIKRTEEI